MEQDSDLQKLTGKQASPTESAGHGADQGTQGASCSERKINQDSTFSGDYLQEGNSKELTKETELGGFNAGGGTADIILIISVGILLYRDFLFRKSFTGMLESERRNKMEFVTGVKRKGAGIKVNCLEAGRIGTEVKSEWCDPYDQI